MPPKTSGFWMFVMAQGTAKGVSPEDARKQSASKWDSLTEEQREEWRQKARNSRGAEKGAPPPMPAKRKQISQASPDISKTLRIRSVVGEEGYNRCSKFIVADILLWCDAVDKGKTLPAEIALTKFSIEGGVLSTLSWILPALEIPEGHQWDMRKSSEDGHKLLTADGFTLGKQNPEKEVRGIVYEILQFIGCNSRQDEPIIYAMPEKEDIVEKALHYIMNKVGVTKKEASFIVCPLDALLLEICLNSKYGKEASANTIQVAHIQLQKNTSYLWMEGLKCHFHSTLPEDEDVTNEHCARALSRTHAFRFLAVACVAHDVPMLPNVHFHEDPASGHVVDTPAWPTADTTAPGAFSDPGMSLPALTDAPDPDTSALTENDSVIEDLSKRFGSCALEE